MTEALTRLFDDVVAHWGAYLAALVALSGLTMSLLQVAKDLLFLRRRFHRRRILGWLHQLTDREARTLAAQHAGSPLEEELLRLASAGNAGALYDAELEDVCVQLSAVAQVLVDYPSQSRDLLEAIARAARENDLQAIIAADDTGGDRGESGAADRQRVFDARARVRALAHRSVESFRLSTAAEWRWSLQAASFAISVLVAALALVMSGGLRDRPLTVVASALVAGFLAPVARDLLAAVQQLRRQ